MRLFKAGNSEFRFTIPVIAECIFSSLIVLVISSIVGGISGSALAAVVLINTMMNTLSGVACFIVTGSSILTARYVGADDREKTAENIEQSILAALLFGCALSALCLIGAHPILKLLLPNAEESVFEEAMGYYRIQMLSYPFMVLYNTLVAELRASGNSKMPLAGAIALNATLLLASWLLIRKLQLNVIGAGLAYVIGRAAGAAVVLVAALMEHRRFRIRIRNVIKPKIGVLKHITLLGIPASIQSTSVQAAYLIANSIAMGLGTFEAAVYSVITTLNSFPSLTQSICSAVVVPFIGQALGAKNYDGAKAKEKRLMLIGLTANISLSVLLAVFGHTFVALYTQDAEQRVTCARLLWMMILYAAPALAINVDEPVLTTAGDLKYVARLTMFAVWVIKLPLTLLFGLVFHMGAMGVLLANIVSLMFRAVFVVIRVRQGKWIYLKV